jgi:pimeloyl-ACP methyl ester carboxylesterase
MKGMLLAIVALVAVTGRADGAERVVLLHGMGRTPRSMARMERGLREAGFEVANLGYPSTSRGIEDLARETLEPVFAAAGTTQRVHFVTHSLGGILVRVYAAARKPAALGRVVMLAPPNDGSELADALESNIFYRAATGPAGQQLGTGSNSVPLRLGPVEFELGVIAGNRTLNPVYSHIVPGVDDGKVSVERARVEGMRDFLVVPASHTWIMNDPDVIAQTVRFLREGRFAKE